MDEKIIQNILNRLREMRLPEMANQIVMMQESGELSSLSTEEILDRITSEELMSRKNNTIQRYLKAAKLSQPGASLNELDHDPKRKLNEAVLKQITDGDYIEKKRNILLLGACGTGKSYLANALATEACNRLHPALYCRMFELIDDIDRERLESGQTIKTVRKYAKPDVIVIDDFMNASLNERESLDLFKILEYRINRSSTIICSQLEPKEWYEKIPNPILSDSLLDRITGGAYKLILSGDSYRQKKN